jgi:hypothetical protein
MSDRRARRRRKAGETVHFDQRKTVVDIMERIGLGVIASHANGRVKNAAKKAGKAMKDAGDRMRYFGQKIRYEA